MVRVRGEVLLLGLLWTLSAHSAPPVRQTEPGGRLRAGYMGSGDLGVLPDMTRAGMNAALVKFGNLAGPDVVSYEAAMLPAAESAAKAGIAFFPVRNWWGASEPRWVKGFEAYVTASGESLKDTPCPS